jgi:hypothetical protein
LSRISWRPTQFSFELEVCRRTRRNRAFVARRREAEAVVVNHDVVTGGGKTELIGIYHLTNGAIANEWLILG